jgi:hypothetical protein
VEEKNDKDVRKEIEELEKLIEIVREQHKEEKKSHKEAQKRSPNQVIRIDLGAKYSANFPIHLIVSFLVNFILIFTIIRLFGLAEVDNDYNFIWIAAIFTLYEELYKIFLIKRFVKVVIYSSGLIFFLMNLIFFYAFDLLIMKDQFTFATYLYPILFVLIFQFMRMIIKMTYHQIIRKMAQMASRKSTRGEK